MGFLDGSSVAPSPLITEDTAQIPNPAYKKWRNQDRMLLSLIYASLSEECMAEVVNCATARDAWLTLETSFSHRSKTREIQLKDELQLLQRGSRSVAEYARSFRSLCDQLIAIGKSVDDTDKVHWFLRGLGPDYKIFSTTMLSQCPLPSFANIVPQALSHELFSRSLHGDAQQQSAFITSRGSSTFSAGRNKHYTSSKMDGRNSSKSATVSCQWCGKDNHTARKCYKLGKLLKKAKDGGPIEAFSVTSLPESLDTEWYMDTGATSHMTNDAMTLDSSIPYNGSGNKSGGGSRPM